MSTIDLVKRLRTMAKTGWNPIGDEAADEIERLRSERDLAVGHAEALREQLRQRTKERDL
jgi:hypothetical protein